LDALDALEAGEAVGATVGLDGAASVHPFPFVIPIGKGVRNGRH
jgi:hypothetical protein